MSFKIMSYMTWFGFANHLALNACFVYTYIHYEKWVQGEKYPSKARLPYYMIQISNIVKAIPSEINNCHDHYVQHTIMQYWQHP
jgi:hypothetical protein